MVGIQHVATLQNGTLAFGARVSGFATLTTGSGTYLFAGAQTGLGMTSYSLTAGQAANPLGWSAYTAGADISGLARLDFITHDGSSVLLPSGRLGSGLGGQSINANGSFGGYTEFSGGGGIDGALSDLATIRIGTTSWIYGVTAGSDRIEAWSLADGGSTLLHDAGFTDDWSSLAKDVTAMTTASVNGERWLHVASGAEDGVTSFRILSDGSLQLHAATGARDGLGIDAPSALQSVTIGNVQFLIVAGTGSSSLSVLRVDADGLTPTDHVNDTLATRFQSVIAFDAVTVGGRTYVIAGGGDDGMSVFQLLPDGRLILMTGFADTATTALSAVAAIEAVAVGGEIQVFTASGDENGISQFRLTLGNPGLNLSGTIGDDVLSGAGADDAILGGKGNDRILGGGGDDILVDGAGSDTLTGGAGRDLFVLLSDGAVDRILDFDINYDRLDLSDFVLLHSVSALTIDSTSTGARITYGQEVVEITSSTYSPLTASDFTSANTLNLPRSPLQTIVAERTETGTPGDDAVAGNVFNDHLDGLGGNDTLWGGTGNDTLIGGVGRDLLDGGSGIDIADYQTAGTGVTADLMTPSANSGDAEGDAYVDIEGLAGSEFADDLRGNAQDNYIRGRGGADLLNGRDGQDHLDGGSGDDRLRGGNGADLLDGGSGFDFADYSDSVGMTLANLADRSGNTGAAAGDSYVGIEGIIGGDYNDWLGGDGFANALWGGAGSDTLSGGGGDDTLRGGVGADRLEGGPGFDRADYSDTTVGLVVDMVNSQTSNGIAKGDVFFGVEGLIGSIYADDLRGDALANEIGGGDGHDWLTGRAGNDTLIAGDGNDNLVGGAGADLMDGGAGTDRASYADAPSGLVVDLLQSWLNTGVAAGDILISVENLMGSSADDTLAGDDVANGIDGGTGNDVILGRGGNDWLRGRAGNDTLEGMDGNDILLGGPGSDRFIGGAGIDRAHYGDSAQGLTVDLMIPAANTGLAAGDTYSGIENLQGSPSDDILWGDDSGNYVMGARGDDIIFGRGGGDFLVGADGDDTIAGMSGNDTLIGGFGSDTFVFSSGDGFDRIMDFETGLDTLRFSANLSGISGMTDTELIAAHARTTPLGVEFSFAGGELLLIRNVLDPTDFIGDIVIG